MFRFFRFLAALSLLVGLGAASPLPEYRRLSLFELSACADLVVKGRIDSVSFDANERRRTFPERSDPDRMIVVSVEETWVGEPSADKVRVLAFEDWTCAARWRSYGAGQRVVLFLLKPEKPSDLWTILGAGDEGELPILEESARISDEQNHHVQGFELQSPVIDGIRTHGYLLPLDALRDAVRGFRETFDYAISRERDPVQWIRPKKGLAGAEAYAATSPIARHLFQTALSSSVWKGDTGQPPPQIFPREAKLISAEAHQLSGPARIRPGREPERARSERSSGFGRACADLGDVDGDGIEDLAVGAPNDSITGHYHGALWILFQDGKGGVRQFAEIREGVNGFPASMNEFASLGGSVAGLGDLDGDGIPDLVVGAQGWDGTDKDRGGVWILYLTRAGAVSRAVEIGSDPKLREVGIGVGAGIGASLANLGDIDGDGSPEIVIGQAPEFDKGMKEGRSVFIVSLGARGEVRWARRIHDRKEGIDPGYSWFGQAVTGLGDLDGDGVRDLAASNPNDSDGAGLAGAVWILLLKEDGSLKSKHKISAWHGGFRGLLHGWGNFGGALCGPGDVDGDGTPDLLARSAEGIWILLMDRVGTVRDQRRVVRSDPDESATRGFGTSIAARRVRGEGEDIEVAIGGYLQIAGERVEPCVWLARIDSSATIRSW